MRPIAWQMAIDAFIAKHNPDFELDQGDISDQDAWKMLALHLVACSDCCANRVEFIEELLRLVKVFEIAAKLPKGTHAQLALLFDSDNGVGEFLIGDLERREGDRGDT